MSDTATKCCHEGIHWFPRVTVEKYSPDQTAFAQARLDNLHSWGHEPYSRRIGRPVPQLEPQGNYLEQLFREPEDGYAYDEGNLLVQNGLSNLVYLMFGAPASGGFGRPFVSGAPALIPAAGTNETGGNLMTGVGVGDNTGSAARAATTADTHLWGNGGTEGAADTWYQQMDVGFLVSATPSSGLISGQVSVTGSNANFATGWWEWCWFTMSAYTGTANTLAGAGTNTNMLNHKVVAGGLGTKGSGATWVFSTTITWS